MSKPRWSYDSECERLADHFLQEVPHTEEQRNDLAQEIQETVEDFLGDLPPPAGARGPDEDRWSGD